MWPCLCSYSGHKKRKSVEEEPMAVETGEAEMRKEAEATEDSQEGEEEMKEEDEELPNSKRQKVEGEEHK